MIAFVQPSQAPILARPGSPFDAPRLCLTSAATLLPRELRFHCSRVRRSQQQSETRPQLPLVPARGSAAAPEQPRAPHFRCELLRRSALGTRFASGGMAGAGPAAALAAAGAGRSPKPPAIVLSPEVVLHDRCNLVALPIVGGLVLAGLLGAVDTLLVCAAGLLRVGGGWRVVACLACISGAGLASFSGRAVQNCAPVFLLLTGHQGLHPVHCGGLFLHPAGAQGRALSVRALAGCSVLLHNCAALSAVPLAAAWCMVTLRRCSC